MKQRRAFSLAELLLAIFILGIGVIAVAALFPAGIAQQQRSIDDVVGPIVANNALAILRTKLSPDDFGTFEEFGPGAVAPDLPAFSRNESDWPWMRPSVYFEDDPQTVFPDDNSPLDDRGFIDVFSNEAAGTTIALATEIPGGSNLLGIPYNTAKHAGPPRIIITQAERYFPASHSALLSGGAREPRPQYVWDCMFRRFQGRVLVAIFVYRVSVPGGESFAYRVPPGAIDPTRPPIPHRLLLAQAWDVDGDPTSPQRIDPIIPGTEPGTLLDLSDRDDAWQAPSQWLLDQNNNVHRVLVGRRRVGEGPVELRRAIPALPFDPALGQVLPVYTAPSADGQTDVVTDLWYIPTEIELDITGDGELDGLTAMLTPVYVAVREL